MLTRKLSKTCSSIKSYNRIVSTSVFYRGLYRVGFSSFTNLGFDLRTKMLQPGSTDSGVRGGGSRGAAAPLA